MHRMNVIPSHGSPKLLKNDGAEEAENFFVLFQEMERLLVTGQIIESRLLIFSSSQVNWVLAQYYSGLVNDTYPLSVY